MLADWEVVEKTKKQSAGTRPGQESGECIEVLWMNFDPALVAAA